MKRLLTSSIVMAVTVPGLAHATSVYPGCAAPSLKASHHTFYIDPVHGSQSGDGSAAKPWHTLAEVLNTSNKLLSTTGHNSRTWNSGDTSLSAINPNGPIKAGDVLMLKTGNHGDVKLTNSYNTDFVTVMAAPGQTPVLSSLNVVSSGRWVFQGVKVAGAHPRAGGVSASIDIGRSDFIGTTTDIVIDNVSISSTDNTSGWTDNDWKNSTDAYEVFMASGKTCLALTSSHLYNGMNGVAMGSDNSLVQGNTIELMYNDGIDFFGSNQTIKQNTIKNNVNNPAASSLHPDGIQGWSVVNRGVTTLNKNDVVDSNYLIKTGDGNVTQMQGISVFDGDWDGLQIINNVVVSDVYHGIAVYGGKNVSIINNTVLQSDPNFGTWILANKSKSNAAGTNVVVRNNIASNIVIGYPQVTFDHNVAIKSIQTRDASNKLTVTSSGTVGSANKVNPGALAEFVTANPATAAFDLRLRSNSVAIAAGSTVAAPTYDIVSKKRTTPVDAGAYQH